MARPITRARRRSPHALLVAAVLANDSDAIATGHRLAAIDDLGEAARLDFADRPTVHAAVVIAADSRRPQPDFRRHVALRSPAISPGGCWSLRLRRRQRRGCPDRWSGPGPERSFVRYPVRGGALINCVGLTRSGGWRGEGWSQSVPAAAMAAEFAGWVPDVTDLIAAAPGGTVGSWGLFVPPAGGTAHQWRHRAAWRRRPPDAAVHGPGCCHGDRGWRCARPLLCGCR